MINQLTVILPIRATEDRKEVLENISFIFLDSKIPNSIQFTIIDDGSKKEYASKIKLKCKEYSINYYYLDTSTQDFSLARARNEGAKNSITEFIMFQDIDMMPYDGFYNDLLSEVKIQELNNNKKSFLMLSSIYLTNYASDQYQTFSKQFLIDKMILNDNKYVEKFSTATSLILLNRKHFFDIGGYDENFVNWGHEDIDLNCRLILEDNLFSLPKNFTKDEKNFNNIYQYEGWKSIYRLYGDRTFLKGLFLFHSWHETVSNTNYYLNKDINKKYFHKKLQKNIKKYKKKYEYLLTTDSILFDRYKFSLSKSNRFKCNSVLDILFNKIKKNLKDKK